MVNIFIRQMAQQTECREKNYGQKSDIQNMQQHTLKTFGRITIVFHNIGVISNIRIN